MVSITQKGVCVRHGVGIGSRRRREGRVALLAHTHTHTTPRTYTFCAFSMDCCAFWISCDASYLASPFAPLPLITTLSSWKKSVHLDVAYL